MKKDDFNAENLENKNGANFEAETLENENENVVNGATIDDATAELAAKQAANIINVRYGQNRTAAIAALRPLFIHMRAEAAARAVLPKKNLTAEAAKQTLDQALGEMRAILISQATVALNALQLRLRDDIIIVTKDGGGEFEVDENDLDDLIYKKDREAPEGSTLWSLRELLRSTAEKQALRDAERRAAAEARKGEKPKISNAEILAAVKDGTLTVVKKIDAQK